MKIALLLLVSLMIYSCHKPIASEITKVEFAKGTCLGPCIPLAISIDSSLDYKFYADSAFTWNKIRPKQIRVNYIGRINRQLWDDIVTELNDADYKHIDTSKKVELMDAQHSELIIYYNNKKLRIYEPDKKFDDVMALLDTSYKMITLHPTNRKLQFGTTLQNPLDLYKK